jgi:hypothetical protein
MSWSLDRIARVSRNARLLGLYDRGSIGLTYVREYFKLSNLTPRLNLRFKL